MSDEVRRQVAEALQAHGITTAAPASGTPAAAPAPAQSGPTSPPPAPAAPAIDYSELARHLAPQLGGQQAQQPAHGQGQQQPQSFTALLEAAAQGQQQRQGAVPSGVVAGSPRRVNQLESDGLIDIWSLSSEEVNQMGMKAIREAHERIREARRQRQGAPPRPRFLRDGRGR